MACVYSITRKLVLLCAICSAFKESAGFVSHPNKGSLVSVKRLSLTHRGPHNLGHGVEKSGLKMSIANEDAERKLRLREEADNPFRQVRLFLYGSLAGSAFIGFMIIASRLAAKASGIIMDDSLEKLSTDLAINGGAMVILGFLFNQDLKARNSRLQRMQQGARIAALRVKDEQEKIVQLSEYRRDRGNSKRVVIFAGNKEMVANSIVQSNSMSNRLVQTDLLAVPVVLEKTPQGSIRCISTEQNIEEVAGQPHIGLPCTLGGWNEWISSELEVASGQGIDAYEDGIVFVIKKNGRVGQRAKGCPPWNIFIGDVEKRAELGMDVKNI